MLDLLILINQRHGMDAAEFESVVKATIAQMHASDQEAFQNLEWDRDRPDALIRAVGAAIGCGQSNGGGYNKEWIMRRRLLTPVMNRSKARYCDRLRLRSQNPKPPAPSEPCTRLV